MNTNVAAATVEAVRVIAASATEALQVSNKQRAEDHDLLVRVDEKVGGLKIAVDKLTDQDKEYVLKEDFFFWRNILVSGLLLSIAIGILARFLLK